MALFKSLFGISLTYSDLLRETERLISNPPLPQDWKTSAVGVVGRPGVDLLGYWRDYFRSQLKTISGEETWSLQRAKLLELVMTELSWRAAYTAAQNAQSVDSWSHLLNDVEWTKGAPKEHWKDLLPQRWLMAILSDACLRKTGRRVYALDQTKDLELNLYYEFDEEIESLDVYLLDQMNSAVHEYRDDDAHFIAGVRDDVVNPIIREQYRILALIGNDIANGSVDVESITARIRALDEKKTHLAEQLRSGGRRLGPLPLVKKMAKGPSSPPATAPARGCTAAGAAS